ncbi:MULTISPECIES: isochorismatase family protein [unclassified Rhizobium]|uniref:isochorismatase family protein n=1 Tax=unclassified Rhizobium TaxID=2613769 RepID=UPI001ADB58F2|nr:MULTISPECIES: isochorismatase family protein [unclassified Rhizobium]MBO9172466.1 isochorismatase family protein [Rhizobium sp. L245/93]
MRHIVFAPSTTALLVIDLQEGILQRALAPHSSETVVTNAAALAKAVATFGGLTVRVKMDFSKLPGQPTDAESRMPDPLPLGFSEFSSAVCSLSGPVVTKRQWGAFHDTELDILLNRGGITAVIIAGIATNFGVESTAREAWQHGYSVIIAEDGCSSLSREMHEFAVHRIFPAIARVRSTGEIIHSINEAQR